MKKLFLIGRHHHEMVRSVQNIENMKKPKPRFIYIKSKIINPSPSYGSFRSL